MIESIPPLLGGRYRPIRLLGRGGMGCVFEVEHAHTGEHFALKMLRDRALADDPALERFRREARVSTRIKSEHVVRVIDADVAPELGDAPYLVMELLEGQDMDRACGDIAQPAGLVVEWLRQVAMALDKAHALGIVHRDLKPKNLFLARSEDGGVTVKVLDFGLAKVTLGGGASTASDEILGTPLFMAPEQAELDVRPITPQADLFAFGLIAHKLLTGRHYWNAQFFVQLVREICLHPMPPASQRGSTLGEAFDTWFARACHRDPAMRFETASAQIEALAFALGGPLTAMRPKADSAPAVSSRSGPRLRRGALPAAIFVGGVAAAAVGAFAGEHLTASGGSPRADVPPRGVPLAPIREVAPPSISIPASVPAASETSSQTPAAPRPPASIVPGVRAAGARSNPAYTPVLPSSSARRPPPRDPWADQK
jgi:serine/threonine-protein kinase